MSASSMGVAFQPALPVLASVMLILAVIVVPVSYRIVAGIGGASL